MKIIFIIGIEIANVYTIATWHYESLKSVLLLQIALLFPLFPWFVIDRIMQADTLMPPHGHFYNQVGNIDAVA